ncbi:MAG: hypothetical protein AB9842_03600 [Bacteroidales bacterium]
MKKRLLFSLLGGVIIFIWQFLSYAMPNFHKSATKFTPHQNEILQKFSELGLQEGMYLLGQPDPSLTEAEREAQYKDLDGKPWAVINYQARNSMDMTMPMIRGILVCMVISFLLFWIYQQQKDPSLMNRLYVSLAIGMIAFFFIPYTNFIWYKEPDIFGHFADAIVPWALLGVIGHKMTK